MVCEPWWFGIFDSSSLIQANRLFEPLKQGFWLAYYGVLYESTERADGSFVRFQIKICLK